MDRDLVIHLDVRVRHANDRADLCCVLAKVARHSPSFETSMEIFDPALLRRSALGLSLALLLGLFFTTPTLGCGGEHLLAPVGDDVQVRDEFRQERLELATRTIAPMPRRRPVVD